MNWGIIPGGKYNVQRPSLGQHQNQLATGDARHVRPHMFSKHHQITDASRGTAIIHHIEERRHHHLECASIGGLATDGAAMGSGTLVANAQNMIRDECQRFQPAMYNIGICAVACRNQVSQSLQLGKINPQSSCACCCDAELH